MPTPASAKQELLGEMPAWTSGDLPAPAPRSWRNWVAFIGPGIVMCGIQIGGGEWLLGPEFTARYGGGMMWIATVSILLQVVYNLECGRYALFCGEPIMAGFLRLPPGPGPWLVLVGVLSLGALIPALSTSAAASIAALYLDRPPLEGDKPLVVWLSFACLGAVILPVLVGGKIYHTLRAIMTMKVFVVLGFCLLVGIFLVSPANWAKIFVGFLEFGNVPVAAEGGKGERLDNVFTHWFNDRELLVPALAQIAVLGAFAGYAGGGGLGNSTYSNYVRDQGWGMGSQVGAIASAFGGHKVQLSHSGQRFPITEENLRRWRAWWRYLLMDQFYVWAPGCFMGMALPALISIQFAEHSPLYHATEKLDWAQAIISADGLRHSPLFTPLVARLMWTTTLLVGLIVLLPSQMSIIEDFSRRWTDMLWIASRRIRERLHGSEVRYVYYTILGLYVLWVFLASWLFNRYGTPKLMVLVVANLNNVALGLTSLQLLWANRRLLPRELQPRWWSQVGLLLCALFNLGLAALVFFAKQLPAMMELLGSGSASS